MTRAFDYPVPGESLTTTPKNAPYEGPPEITDPEEALMFHLDRFSDEEVMENALYLLEYGIDLVSLVEGVLRGAVMNGIHTIDVSLIIGPIIHEYIKGSAEAADIQFDEGFEDKEGNKKLSYKKREMMAKKKLKEMKFDTPQKEEEEEILMEDEEPEEIEQEQEEVKPKGLMARG